MITAIIDSFGICMPYVFVVGMVSVIWDMVLRAFTRGY